MFGISLVLLLLFIASVLWIGCRCHVVIVLWVGLVVVGIVLVLSLNIIDLVFFIGFVVT